MSESDDEVHYLDEPLVEEDSGNENETSDNVKSAKKRKFEILRNKQLEIKKQKSIHVNTPVLYDHPINQYELLKSSQLGIKSIHKSIEEDDILTVNNKCPVTIIDALALSGIKKLIKEGASLTLNPGNPIAVVLCASASRCSDVIANISNRYHCRIAKLFAKHMKLEDQIETLKSIYPIAVGTPNRIQKLIELGAFSFSQCSTVIFDISLDSKQFHLLSWPETSADTYKLIEDSIVPELSHIKLSLIQEAVNVSQNTIQIKQQRADKYKSYRDKKARAKPIQK